MKKTKSVQKKVSVKKTSKKPITKKEIKVKPEKNISLYFIIALILIFIFVQAVGLFTASFYASLQDLRIALITDNPDDVINAIFIIFKILLFTGIILLIRKFSKKTGYLRFFEYMALFFGIVIVLDTIIPYIFALYLSVCFLCVKYILDKQDVKGKKIIYWYNNILLGIAIAGAGAIIGLSLGIIPVLVFLILLSIYDIIAVFYTKHMITLAKTFSKSRMALIFYIPTKERVYQLGGGDLVIPLVVSSSFYFYLIQFLSLKCTLLSIFLVWFASLLGLFLTFYILKVRKLKAMPALPLQALFMIIVIILIITFI